MTSVRHIPIVLVAVQDWSFDQWLGLGVSLSTFVGSVLVSIGAFVIGLVVAVKSIRGTFEATAEAVRQQTIAIKDQIASAAAIARSQRISEKRQEWIDRVRLTVAELQTQWWEQHHLRKQMGAFQAVKGTDATPAKDIERLRNAEFRLSLLQNELKLLINPAEPEHQVLVECASSLRLGVPIDQAMDAEKRLVELSQKILKGEWERVKRGE